MKYKPFCKTKRPRRRQVQLPGLPFPITVVPDEEMAKAEYVICMPDEGPAYFTDDVKTDCVACGRRIKHRPYMPATAKKICIECFGEMSEKEEQEEAEKNGRGSAGDQA